MKQIDLSGVEAQQDGEYKNLTPGGYVCRITKAEDVPLDPATGKGSYLRLEFDIAEGDFAGYFGAQFQRFGKWHGVLIRSYKEQALGLFKGFVKAVEESNPGYRWQWNEATLTGKLIGIVFGEEEYVNRMYQPAVSVKPRMVRSVQAIRAGDFTIPAIKKLKTEQAAQVQQVAQDTANGYTASYEQVPPPF